MKCNHLYDRKCLNCYMITTIEREKALKFPTCNGAFKSSDCLKVTLRDYQKNPKFKFKKISGVFIYNNEERSSLPESHKNLLERGLTVREMYETLGLIDYHNRLNDHNISVKLIDVSMLRIENVIKDLEESMMTDYEFSLLATSSEESGLVGGYPSSSSSSSDESDHGDISYNSMDDSDCKPIQSKMVTKKEQVKLPQQVTETVTQDMPTTVQSAYTKRFIKDNLRNFCLFVSSCPVIYLSYRLNHSLPRDKHPDPCMYPFHEYFEPLKSIFFIY